MGQAPGYVSALQDHESGPTIKKKTVCHAFQELELRGLTQYTMTITEFECKHHYV